MAAVAEVEHAVQTHMRPVDGPVNIPLAPFPGAEKSQHPVDPDRTASDIVQAFNQALDKRNFPGIANLFLKDGFWRDHLALSWQLRTVQGTDGIVQFLSSCSESRDGLRLKKISIDRSSSVRAPTVCPIDPAGEVQGIQFFFSVETSLGSGVGVARLVPQNGSWKIFTFYTALQELKGHEELTYHRRVKGVEHGGHAGRKNWAEQRTADCNYENGKEPTVLIIGKPSYLS